jgi:methylmalonyl-CoA mutase N-terminal domain/subunit
VEKGEKIIVGVNKFQVEEKDSIPGFRIDDSIRKLQSQRLVELRKGRNPARCDQVLQTLSDKASSGENIMPSVIDAVEKHCTLGEIADTLREVFGEYK